MRRLSGRLLLAVILVASCAAPSVTEPHTAPPSQPAPICRDRDTVPMLRNDWDPDFKRTEIDQVRSVGGFYRALSAARREQHRSSDGPTFRVACGDQLELRLLLGIPSGDGRYAGVIVGFVDYEQVELRIDGEAWRKYSLDLARGREYVLSVATPRLSAGTHRFALIVFDDDHLPGLFGWHDLLADVYVGGTPTPLKLPAPRDTSTRADAAIANANYGVVMTVLADRLRLAGNVNWEDGLQLYASVYGSPREDGRPAPLVLLQNFEQQGPPLTISTRAGRVAVVPFRPHKPSSDFESIRAVIFTNPDRELAPGGTYDQQDLFASFASQKAYLRIP